MQLILISEAALVCSKFVEILDVEMQKKPSRTVAVPSVPPVETPPARPTKEAKETKERPKSSNSSHVKEAALKKQLAEEARKIAEEARKIADKAAAVWLKDRVKKTISLCRKHFVWGMDARGGCC